MFNPSLTNINHIDINIVANFSLFLLLKIKSLTAATKKNDNKKSLRMHRYIYD